MDRIEKQDVLIIIDSSDIQPALEMSHKLKNYQTYIFDPVLQDKVTAYRFKNVKFFAWDNCSAYSELVEYGTSQAHTMEMELAQLVKDIDPHLSIESWQYTTYYLFFVAYKWYSGLWQANLFSYKDKIFHVFMDDKPLFLVFSSFLPALLLLQKLLADGIEFKAYSYGRIRERPDLVPNFNEQIHEDGDFILTHLQTCMHDYKYFSDEIELSKYRSVNISSEYWDVNVCATHSVSLVEPYYLGGEFLCQYEELINKITVCIDNYLATKLGPFITSPEFIRRQIERLTNSYRSQIITYYGLSDFFGKNKPAKMLISEHNSGFFGPLVLFAKRNNIPVLMVPHSKTIDNLKYDRQNLIALTHPIQGEDVLDYSGQSVQSSFISYPEQINFNSIAAPTMQKVGLLLNDISLHGVFSTNYQVYIDGIVKIYQWCISRNIDLLIRCRPGYSIIFILSELLGIELVEMTNLMSMDIKEYAKLVDFCLMYDTPTTGAIYFLNCVTPILNPLPDQLERCETRMANSKIIPRHTVESTLKILDFFIADNAGLHKFRLDQFGKYITSYGNSLPLRFFLSS